MTTADTDAPKLYDRQPGEPAIWYRRFAEFYLPQIGRRSLLAAINAERARKAPEGANKNGAWRPPSWRKAAERWNWPLRAAAYDDAQASLAVAEWTRRRAAQREREWETSQKLLDKALQMLQFPLASVKREGDKTTIEPGDWNLRDAAYIAEIASKLARLSLDMTQGRYTFTDQELNERIEKETDRIASAKAQQIVADRSN